MTKLIYKTSNGIYLVKWGDAYLITTDENWHLSNCIQVTDLFVAEFAKEFGFHIDLFI